mgnify:CR=1 FL=1
MTGVTENVPVYNKTPLVREFLSKGTNAPKFYVKYEAVQPSRSFKSRGIGHLILTKVNDVRKSNSGKTIHVFSSSGGNAGYAAAVACSRLNIRCTVVVPVTAKAHMIRKIREVGAEVIIKGAHWSGADDYLRNEVIDKCDKQKVETIYVHPFDDPLVWEGHSMMIDEIIETLEMENVDFDKVKGIICSVGGGGLYNGIMTGLCRHNLADKIPVIAVETIGTDSLNCSIKANKLITLDKITSVATSLGSTHVTEKTLEFAKKYNSKSVVLPDVDVIKTSLEFTDFSNFITEPACAASIHLGYYPNIIEDALGQLLEKDDIIIVIACGGSTCAYKDLEDMQSKI